MEDVLGLMREIVLSDIYLFTVPPRKVMEKKELAMTLADLDVVPTGTFHLGLNGKLVLNKDFKCYLES